MLDQFAYIVNFLERFVNERMLIMTSQVMQRMPYLPLDSSLVTNLTLVWV